MAIFKKPTEHVIFQADPRNGNHSLNRVVCNSDDDMKQMARAGTDVTKFMPDDLDLSTKAGKLAALKHLGAQRRLPKVVREALG